MPKIGVFVTAVGEGVIVTPGSASIKFNKTRYSRDARVNVIRYACWSGKYLRACSAIVNYASGPKRRAWVGEY